MKKLFTTTMLVLVTLTGLAQIKVEPLQLLLQQGDSTFNTLYSAGMCHAQLKDYEQARDYYQQFLTLARQEENPNEQLSKMITESEKRLEYYKTTYLKKNGN